MKTLSNGTHDFAPTTVLISLDGFRADFLHRGLTPTLKSFVQQGVSPMYMMPSFPSLTFPNHFTLVTGLYPSEHGEILLFVVKCPVTLEFTCELIRVHFQASWVTTSMIPSCTSNSPMPMQVSAW